MSFPVQCIDRVEVRRLHCGIPTEKNTDRHGKSDKDAVSRGRKIQLPSHGFGDDDAQQGAEAYADHSSRQGERYRLREKLSSDDTRRSAEGDGLLLFCVPYDVTVPALRPKMKRTAVAGGHACQIVFSAFEDDTLSDTVSPTSNSPHTNWLTSSPRYLTNA